MQNRYVCTYPIESGNGQVDHLRKPILLLELIDWLQEARQAMRMVLTTELAEIKGVKIQRFLDLKLFKLKFRLRNVKKEIVSKIHPRKVKLA